MKEGAWINGRTFEIFWVPEHAQWIQNKENATKLGLDEATYEEIKGIPNDFNGPNREKILLTVMKAGPFIRMRGQGNLFAFEFLCASSDALWGAYVFGQKYAGEYTTMRLNNLRTKESVDIYYSEFKKAMDEDERKILRLAKSFPDKRLSRFAAKFLNSLDKNL